MESVPGGLHKQATPIPRTVVGNAHHPGFGIGVADAYSMATASSASERHSLGGDERRSPRGTQVACRSPSWCDLDERTRLARPLRQVEHEPIPLAGRHVVGVTGIPQGAAFSRSAEVSDGARQPARGSATASQATS
jgi:hypothetical protein